MRFPIPAIALISIACKGEPTVASDPPPTPEPTADTGPTTCGDAAPVVAGFSVGNGTSAPTATGTSLLLTVAITDADGDLAPDFDVLVLWDTVIDGAVGSTANGFGITVQVAQPACGAPSVGIETPVLLSSILARDNTPMPFSTPIEYQLAVTDNDGKITNDLEGHVGLSAIVVACSPNSDGTDGVCP